VSEISAARMPSEPGQDIEKEKVLLVDDEESLLKVYSHALQDTYNVVTASNGKDALAKLEQSGPFAMVISDMHMPGMDGVKLLEAFRQKAPDTVRIMLTGDDGIDVATNAINKGAIFRFISKPPRRDTLTAAAADASQQYHLVQAEQSVLQQTVNGSVEALTNVLQIANPTIFGRSTRFRRLMTACVKQLGAPNVWELETAASLSHIGMIAAPTELVAKYFSGAPLTGKEKATMDRFPLAGAELLASIPRMSGVSEILRYQLKYYDGSGLPSDDLAGDALPLGARILRVLHDYDQHVESALSSHDALRKLQDDDTRYDRKVLEALRDVTAKQETQEPETVESIHISQLRPGMVIDEAVHLRNGSMLVSAGQTVTKILADKLANFVDNAAIEPMVRIRCRG